MSVSLNILTETTKKNADIIVFAIDECCKALMGDAKCNVSLTLCDDEHIRDLNIQYRDNDNATDVLSFPLLEAECAGEVYIDEFNINPETHEIMLGDIVISVERAEAQAKEFGHTIERELSYLAVHSMLHLVGYDHIQENDREFMRKKEEEILSGIDMKR